MNRLAIFFFMGLVGLLMELQPRADALFINMNASPTEEAAFESAMAERAQSDQDYRGYATPSDSIRAKAYSVGTAGEKLDDILEDPAFTATYNAVMENPGYSKVFESALMDSLNAQKSSGQQNEAAQAYASIQAFRAAALDRSLNPVLLAKIKGIFQRHPDFNPTYEQFLEAKKAYDSTHPPPILKQIQESLNRLKSSGGALDTMVLSGHSGGDNLFSNLQEGLTRCDWLFLSAQYRAQFAQVRQVTLMGCYMASPDSRKFWSQVFPNAEIIEGYNSKAPPESAQTGTYLKEMLRANEKALNDEASKKSESSIDRELIQTLDELSRELGPLRNPLIERCSTDILVPTSQKYSKCDPKQILGGIPGNTIRDFASFKTELSQFSKDYFPADSNRAVSSVHPVDPSLLYKQVQAFLGSEDVCLSELSRNDIPSSGNENKMIKDYLNDVKAKAFVMRNWSGFRQGYQSYFAKELSDLQAQLDKHPAECAQFKDAASISTDWLKFYTSVRAFTSLEGDSCSQAILGRSSSANSWGESTPGNPIIAGTPADVLQKGMTALGYIASLGGAFEHSSWLNGTETDQSWRDEAAHLHQSETDAWKKIETGIHLGERAEINSCGTNTNGAALTPNP
jgi:hypothetical protein